MSAKYYQIDEDAARRAKEAISFDTYKEGSATESYRKMVDEAARIGENQKLRVDPMYHAKIDAVVDAYARRLAENTNAYNRNTASCPSVMISGAGNFPVRKKQKQNARADKLMEEYRGIKGLLDKIYGVGKGGISSDDPQALAKLQAKHDRLVKHQEMMKAANAAIRLKDTTKGDAKLAEMGYTAEQIKQLRKPDFCGRVGYPTYELSNNNANIKRIKARIEELQKRQTEAAPEGWMFDGGEVVMNTEENRVQIIFDGKPDDDMRQSLKSHGFRWAPSQGAWQRQLTDNAIYAAKRVTHHNGVKVEV